MGEPRLALSPARAPERWLEHAWAPAGHDTARAFALRSGVVRLEQELERRLAPLAAGAGLVLAAVPPVLLLAWSAGGPRDGWWWWLAAASCVPGLLAGLVLYLGPVRLIRGELAELTSRLDQLRASESKQRAVNQDLTEWVASAVREVRDLSERVVQIQEEERGRIARDLHDSVGQALAALHLGLELIAGRPAEAAALTGRCIRECEEALSELRRVVYDLRPPELTASADVAEVLRSYTERFELRTGLPTSFRGSGGAIRSEEVSTCLLRVLQEALTNISRHAGAQEVGVSLTVMPGKVSMEVTDDGQGFDFQAPRRGTGLRGIHERCAFLGGSVEVESRPESGTRLRVHLPVTGSTS